MAKILQFPNTHPGFSFYEVTCRIMIDSSQRQFDKHIVDAIYHLKSAALLLAEQEAIDFLNEIITALEQ